MAVRKAGAAKRKGGNGAAPSSPEQRSDVAQAQTQTARRVGNGHSRPPLRTASPGETRRPVGGRLIIIGGHEEKEGERLILRAVADAAKGGRIVVCTVASDVPAELWRSYERTFRELGCKDVVHLDVAERADLLTDPPLDVLEGASVFFFTGGGQLKITTR